ncbi:MAG: DegT/DnrJ/EryC1/StrS family aminotransferase [Deltaproteobacteria bacterium]|nr:DegT/DnrJ/EryC1/StrS family aminotransferase [Deltaproteobacteria bacterium]
MTPFIDLKKQLAALGPALEEAVLAVVRSTQYIGGPAVGELEKALAAYAGVKAAVACANGTDALTLPLLAKGLKPGDAVFCPSFTFVATAEVVALRGATPIFVDIDPVTFNLSPDDLEVKIKNVLSHSPLTPVGVIPVDLFGLPADFTPINRIAKAHGLWVLEDAAQGFGGEYQGQKAGSLAWVGATSFFPAKPLGCYGDGGAVLTNDLELAEVLKSLRGHGAGASRYEHVRIGVNSRLDTLQAAILLKKLAVLPQELLARQKVSQTYSRLLEGRVVTPKIPDGYFSAWAQYTIRVKASQRDQLKTFLQSQGVPTNIYYPLGLHAQPAFLALGGDFVGAKAACPETEKASQEVLSLPMHPYLDEETISQISALIIKGLDLGA